MKRTVMSNCNVCLGPHDYEIHAATVSVHAWLRRIVSRAVGAEGCDELEASEAEEKSRCPLPS